MRIREGSQINPGDFVIREVADPIDVIGLKHYVYSGLGIKDWAGFIEIYGIPGGVVIMPPTMPAGKETDYETRATRIAGGGCGALPYGSDYKSNDSPRTSQPFGDYLRWWEEKLVLAGTGGKLTMLSESGTGTLAGGAHQDTFDAIAAAEAGEITEIFQRQFDQVEINRLFPGQPVLAYFELAAQMKTRVSQIVDHAAKLAQAGYQLDAQELSEKTGYKLQVEPRLTPTL